MFTDIIAVGWLVHSVVDVNGGSCRSNHTFSKSAWAARLPQGVWVVGKL